MTKIFYVKTFTCMLLLLGLAKEARSQSWLPVITTESGDTISYQYPPNDSTYKRNEVIVYFKPEGLRLDKLCYEYSWYRSEGKERETTQSIPNSVRSALLAERFPTDSIVVDQGLAEFYRSHGLTHFRRITVANPCTDTISVARNSDTLKCTDFLWLVGEIDNDTSVVVISTVGTIMFQNQLTLIEPNYKFHLHRNPSDPEFVKQKSFINEQFNVARAWDFQIGNNGVKVGILDNGIDYTHCDFGSQLGYKVVGGWNWVDNNSQFNLGSWHGTPVASIVGALSNRNCVDLPFGVAGVAGGWGPEGTNPDQGIGVQLFGLKIGADGIDSNQWVVNAIAAIREGSSSNPSTGYGYGLHVLNNSYGFYEYTEALRASVCWAFVNQVSVVASSGNNGVHGDPTTSTYPSSFDGTWVSKVGASGIERTRMPYSNFLNRLDFVAPGGNRRIAAEAIVWAAKEGSNSHALFDGTSAAAPHVSGLIALIRSAVIDHSLEFSEPEDFEGIVKAACKNSNAVYNVQYDPEIGWGNADAGRTMEMLYGGYSVHHFSTEPGSSADFTFGEWGPLIRMAFNNEGTPGKPLKSGSHYYARRREVTGVIEIPIGQFIQSESNPVFVWARSGASNAGGWSAANPNYQIPYTEIIDGVTGSSNSRIAHGIYLENDESEIVCRTYQYKVYDLNGNEIGVYPGTDQIKMHISVYAKANPTSVCEGASDSTSSVFVVSDPGSDQLRIICSELNNAAYSVHMTNIAGQSIAITRDGVATDANEISISVVDLPSGAYSIVLILNGSVVRYAKHLHIQ